MEQPQIPPIRLHHMQNKCGLLLSAEPLLGELRHIAADLLLCQLWRQGGADKSQPELSEFNWPLTGNAGTPERALLAFMDKFGIGKAGGRVVFCSDATFTLISAWVPRYCCALLRRAPLTQGIPYGSLIQPRPSCWLFCWLLRSLSSGIVRTVPS